MLHCSWLSRAAQSVVRTRLGATPRATARPAAARTMRTTFDDATVVTSDATGTRRWLTPVHTLDEGGPRMLVVDKADKDLNTFITGRTHGLRHTTYLGTIGKRAQDETLRRAVSIQSGGLYDTADVTTPSKRLKATAVAKQLGAEGRLPLIVDVELPTREFTDGTVVPGATAKVAAVAVREGTGANGKITMAVDPAAIGHVIAVLAHSDEHHAAPRRRAKSPSGPTHVWWCEEKKAVVSQNVHSSKYRTFKVEDSSPDGKATAFVSARAWATSTDACAAVHAVDPP